MTAVADVLLSGRRGARERDLLITARGKPKTIVSDNGTELTSDDQTVALRRTFSLTAIRLLKTLTAPGRREISRRSFGQKIALVEAMPERLAPLKRFRELRKTDVARKKRIIVEEIVESRQGIELTWNAGPS